MTQIVWRFGAICHANKPRRKLQITSSLLEKCLRHPSASAIPERVRCDSGGVPHAIGRRNPRLSWARTSRNFQSSSDPTASRMRPSSSAKRLRRRDGRRRAASGGIQTRGSRSLIRKQRALSPGLPGLVSKLGVSGSAVRPETPPNRARMRGRCLDRGLHGWVDAGASRVAVAALACR
jgi:hypothetical protein